MEQLIEFFTQPVVPTGLFILGSNFAINFYRYKRINTLYGYFCNYHLGNMRTSPQYAEEIKGLFLSAGLQDFTFLDLQDRGFYGIYSGMVSGYNNLFTSRQDVLPLVNRRFNEAIGVYRRRYIGTFNPFYWIECIMRLPESIIKMLGVMPESKWSAVLKLMIWVMFIVLSYLKVVNDSDHVLSLLQHNM